MTRVLVITGMHRSGTSLVASLFNRAGVHLGAQLLPPQSDNNPRGFFEDAAFVDFHQALLHTRGQEILVTRDFILEPDAAETKHARELIAVRANQTLWGWKDPRTGLLLDFWHTLLPDARYLLVYRHPLDVTMSLARRVQVVGFDMYAGLEAWFAYNQSILKFAQTNPAKCILCSSYALLEQIELFNTLLTEKFGLRLSLTSALRDEIFQAELLRRQTHTDATETLLRRIHPDAMQLYATLQQHAAIAYTATLERAPAAQIALAQFAATLPSPTEPGLQRALAEMLAAVLDPALYERFSRAHVQKTVELDAQRRAWEQTALEREKLLREQSAWATARLNDLEKLEAQPAVRALRRLGILPRA